MYPLDLEIILKHIMNVDKTIDSKNGRYYLNEKKDGEIIERINNQIDIKLPQPHPKEYDWRFTKLTRKYISNKLMENAYSTDNILLLGAPTILLDLLHYDPLPNLVLLDNNLVLVDYLKIKIGRKNIAIHRIDLLNDCWNSDIFFEKVFLDPPWYLEYYISFLIQASMVTSIGSTISLVLEPLNTRPEAYDERWKILDTSKRLGFSLIELESKVVHYETPPFEKSALEVNEVQDFDDWRIADLVTLVKCRNTNEKNIITLRKNLPKKNMNNDWFELIYKKYKIMIKGPFNDVDVKPKLISIEKDNILPSVSRSYPNRKNIDLWFSDNRVFKLEGRAAFLCALFNIANKEIPVKTRFSNPSYIAEAVDLLTKLI